jgi:SAM-dependent methyltransferase
VPALPVNDIIEWDVPNWSQLIEYWTPVLEKLPRNSKVLAIGERNGGLSIWLALLGFEVLCTDREGPTETARELHKKYNVADKIKYGEMDIVNIIDPRTEFDLIIAKSVIGGLKSDPRDKTTRNFDVQLQAVNNIYSMLKPGGYFLSAENTQGSVLLKLIRRLKGKDKGWRYFTSDEVSKLYKSFSSVQTKAFGVLPTLFASNILNKLSFITNKYLLTFLPDSAKYVSFTAARR